MHIADLQLFREIGIGTGYSYQKFNVSRQDFEPRAEIYRDKHESLVTDDDDRQVLEK